METKSNLTKYDRIRGAIVGFALGDALGLGSEFMTKEEMQGYYPNKLRDFRSIIRDSHRCQWKPGEATNDSGFFCTLLECILSNGGYDLNVCAKAFIDKIRNTGKDIVPTFRTLLAFPNWEESPLVNTHKIWAHHGIEEGTNEANHRGIALALMFDRIGLDDMVKQLVLMTHDDMRCVASTIILSHMAHSLLHTGKPATEKDLMSVCYAYDTRTVPFLEMAIKGKLEDFELDDQDSMGWTRKNMGSALWTVWHCDNAADSIYAVIDEAGDADSNGAVTGALAGLRFGYDALPDIKNELVDKDYYDDLARRVAAFSEKG